MTGAELQLCRQADILTCEAEHLAMGRCSFYLVYIRVCIYNTTKYRDCQYFCKKFFDIFLLKEAAVWQPLYVFILQRY